MKNSQGLTIVIGVTISPSIKLHSQLAIALRDSGWDVHLVSSPGPHLEMFASDLNVHSIPMERNPSPVKDMISFIKWVKLLRKIRPQVVMAGTPKASFLALLASKLVGIPVRIYFMHGLRFETLRGPLRKVLIQMERLTLACSTQVIAVSDSVRSRVLQLKMGSSRKIALVGKGSAYGIDIEKFRPITSSLERMELRESLGLKANLPVVGFVGRITTDKGIIELAEAISSLQLKSIPLQLLLVGIPEDPAGEQLSTQLRELGINVVGTGKVADPSSLFQAMDIFCLPSYREGLPTVVLEAFASGIPVVATEVTGIVDVVDHRETGILVPAKNAKELADALAGLIEDPEWAKQLTAEALKHVKENFESRAVVQKQKIYIESLVS